MIYRANDIVVLTCDLCGDEDERDKVPSGDAFARLWAYLSERGWKAQKLDDGTWEHACPACAQKHLTKPKLVSLQ